MDRMTPLDAAFLLAEDEEPEVSLAISSIAVFDGPPPSAAEFTALIAGRLPRIPRYRQKVREIPFDLGPPVWIDDEHFDLDYHLRRTALPSPGGDGELAALVSRVMSARLDRSRPLWEYWLVEGLADGRWALISKVHHCMVDGVSGTDLYGVILDDSRRVGAADVDDWRPHRAPSTVALTTDAVRRLVVNPVDQLRTLTGALRHAGRLAGVVRDTAVGLMTLSTVLLPAPSSSLSGPLSAHRRFTWRRASVDDVKTVRRAFGGTFNDVVLAAVTGGFRELLFSRGETPNPDSARTLVPVNVRAPGEESIRDNRVSLMIAQLPVDIDNPVARHALVRHRLDALKLGKESEAGAALAELATHEPFPLLSSPFRVAAHLPLRSVVTVATNVPGPRRRLYALGRPLVEIIPYVPIASTLRTGVSIFTYGGQVVFGVTGDYAAAADIDVLADGIEHALAELVTLAGADA